MSTPVWWQQALLAMAGGAVGSGLRFAIGASLLQRFGTGFPWGTLTVNLVGAFFAGLLMVWLDARGPASWALRALLIVGVMGGLTTFSSLMMECLVFARTERSTLIGLYLAVTLLAGLALVFAGARTGQWLVAR
ncbi:fluoride efflux transporter CrcB [Xanthomonas campestris pv. raphani]|jgi:CrcB protein|uniref:fluoride efflux transporter CrcB n=1 Tax=Xanthomonas campestris TaxID=339 RepID=UPI0005C5AC96|nr:fluoride efflux transporter CrcB [Xanthomonas campestris]MEA9490129.1 fluoride efflux transporter CrcB [Xanthomonas campestris]MEA9508448.1 fluoride efflux transporter CrcB [Xanthomonas campestris]MEA9574384.1 fluoride efflux transporter CrcB [Xanthomonas campestris]MEA9653912.1 fluoride efflux transporter CrcB [Xanthomonas campestris pv. raphani]MEA9658597.1 fluoride efflux transporter CrcB [Xanthomonas campestris pv. raphani]